MARQASIAPPPREAPRLAPNIEAPGADDPKYINFRVTREAFIDIKKAALDEGMKLGDYMVHVHRAYQAKRG